MYKKYLSLIAFILIVVFTAIWLIGKRDSNQTDLQKEVETPVMEMLDHGNPVRKRASFAIFTNGTLRVFTASMYHNLSKDVYIEGDNPTEVIITKEGITWDDFFSTLPLKLTSECLTAGTGETYCTNESKSLKFYINGERKDNILEVVINEGDRLLISFGDDNQEVIDQQLQQVLGF